MPVPIPTQVDPFASPGKWVFVNEQWLSIVLGTLSYALNDSFWQGSQTERSSVIQSTLRLIDGIGELLPPETVTEVKKVVYQLLESDEDENGDDNSMCKCPNSVHYDAEIKAFYYLDANCNRVPIPAFVPSPSANIDDLENGETGIPEGVDTVHDNPLYKTMDSLKCAKATALVNEFWRVMEFGNTLEEVVIYSQVVASIAGIYAIVTPEPTSKTIAAGLAAAAIGLVNEFGLETWRDDLLFVYNDTAGKDALICELVQQMKAPIKLGNVLTVNRMTVDDVAVSINAFAGKYAENALAVKMLKAMSVNGLIEATQFTIAETDCGCTDYIPYSPPADLNAPPADGCIKVFPPSLCYSPYDGQNFDAPIDYWLENEVFGSYENGVLVTEAAGNNGSGSDIFRAGLLYEISPGAQIIEVRWDWSTAPYVQGTGGRTYQFAVYVFNTEGDNSDLVYDVTVTAGEGATINVPVSGTWVSRSHIAITAFMTASTGNPNQAKIRNVQFRIKSAASGFDGWVSAGQDLCD